MGVGAWSGATPPRVEHDPWTAVLLKLCSDLVWLHEAWRCAHQDQVICAFTRASQSSGTTLKFMVRQTQVYCFILVELFVCLFVEYYLNFNTYNVLCSSVCNLCIWWNRCFFSSCLQGLCSCLRLSQRVQNEPSEEVLSLVDKKMRVEKRHGRKSASEP